MGSTLRLGLVALFAVAAVSAGCKGDPPPEEERSALGSPDEREDGERTASTTAPPDEPKKPVEKTPEGVKLTWKKGTSTSQDLEVENTKATGDFTCFPVDCLVRIDDLPEGTKVKIGANEATANDIGTAKLQVDMGDAIGAATPATAFSHDKLVDPKLKLEITFPDGVKVDGDLPPMSVKHSLIGTLKRDLAAGKPVLFGKESTDDEPAQHTIIFMYVLAFEETLIGPGKTMREADLVAIEEQLPERSANKKCSGYKAIGEAGPGRDADHYLVDWEVKLIERRTAKVLETKKFEADPGCPSMATGNKATSYPSFEAVRAWLRTKRT